MPRHRWQETSLQFEQPNGKWGSLVDLKGDRGIAGQTIQRRVGGGGGGSTAKLKNPALTYAAGVVTSIAYDNGSKALTYNEDGTLNTLATTISGVTTTKTLSYNADGTLSSISET
jgi:hypothetical protein